METGAAIYEHGRIAAVKAKRANRKNHTCWNKKPRTQSSPTCPRRQRKFCTLIGFSEHIRTQCTTVPPPPASENPPTATTIDTTIPASTSTVTYPTTGENTLDTLSPAITSINAKIVLSTDNANPSPLRAYLHTMHWLGPPFTSQSP
nr:unnamed protein product [Spirometra erinaceieuropaei]